MDQFYVHGQKHHDTPILIYGGHGSGPVGPRVLAVSVRNLFYGYLMQNQ